MKRHLFHIVALVLLSACSSQDSKLRGEFLAGCITSSGSKTLCTCVLDHLEKKYGIAQMKSIENGLSRPNPSEANRKLAQEYVQSSVQYAMMCRS